MSFRQRYFAIREELAQIRYEKPLVGLTLKISKWLSIFTLCVSALWYVSGTSAGQMLGLYSVKERITYGYQAIYWARKGIPNVESLPVVPERYAGTIEKASEGKLLLKFYDKGRSIRRIVKLSNIVVEDEAKFAQWAKAYLLKPVTVDFYLPTEKYSQHDVWAAVIWVAKKPINIELVEQKIGIPEIDPLTTAVNMIFSQYYFQQATGR